MNKIVFFNHFHRGDIFTHKEFARQIKEHIPNIAFEYWHFNHPKVNRDLGIPLTDIPNLLDKKVRFYKSKDTFFINTWIGVYWDIFVKHGGVNLLTLCESWGEIFNAVNAEFNTALSIREDVASYIPNINYTQYNLENIHSFLGVRENKRALFCNGMPMSNQSFPSNLSNEVESFASKFPNVDFICTSKFNSKATNIYFTDDIIKDTEVYSMNVPWHDRAINNCDVNEIAYLSTKCDLIVGKNSGPFVFCENKDNFTDTSKNIISFSKGDRESMSYGINLNCKYSLVTDHSEQNIIQVIERELATL